LKTAIKNSGMIVKEIAAKAGVSKRTIDKWVGAEETEPKVNDLYKVCQILGITVEYLVTGEDIEGIPQETIFIAQKIAALSPQNKEEIMLLVDHKLGRYPETKGIAYSTHEITPVYGSKIIDISKYSHDEIPMDSVKFVGWDMTILPVVGKTAAGKPIEINVYTDEGMPFPRQLLKGKEEDYFIVEIEGTSMTEAGIKNGDYVIIRKAEEPRNGKIMLVRYDNSSTLKRIKIKETKKDGQQVFLYWEDGSGDFKLADSSEYEIQGEFYRNLGK